MSPPDPVRGFSGAGLDRLADHELVAASIDMLRRTVREIAEMLGVDRRTMQRLASGRQEMRLEQWDRLAQALGAAELLDRRAGRLARACRRRAASRAAFGQGG